MHARRRRRGTRLDKARFRDISKRALCFIEPVGSSDDERLLNLTRDAAARVTRVSVTVSDPIAPKVPRLVDQIYERHGKRTMQLTVWRGALGANDGIAATIGGHQGFDDRIDAVGCYGDGK